MTAERNLNKALRRLEGTNFELAPQHVVRSSDTHIVVPIVWLIVVVEALGDFINNDEWLK